MDTEVQRQEKGLGKVSGGLDSLAAAASRGVENIGIEEELDFKDERTEKSGELHGQKGKVRLSSMLSSFICVSELCRMNVTYSAEGITSTREKSFHQVLR